MRFAWWCCWTASALAPVAAQELRIVRGPAEGQVLQRNAEGTAAISIGGGAAGKRVNGKLVELRLSDGKGAVAGLDWAVAGRIQKLQWSGELNGIPTGGPYRIEARIKGMPSAEAAIGGLLVGDLWILAGQSNMEGHGELETAQTGNAMIRSFDMGDRWVAAKEPLHNVVDAADRIHWPAGAGREPARLSGAALERYNAERTRGAGLGLPFAAAMFERTGVPIGLIPCAHGGTSLEQWDPGLRDLGGDSLYGAMFRRFQAVGGQVKGVLWYQGESDANAKAAPAYEKRFADFVRAVRIDFQQPTLPFYFVQIGRHISDRSVAEWNQVQEAQRRDESALAAMGMVASVDATLVDGIHADTESLKRLGRRMANLACHDLYPKSDRCGQYRGGPRPVSASFDTGVVRVQFTGVNGKLEAEGWISGFTIHDSSGLPTPMIYKTRFDPADGSAVLLFVQGKLPEKASLWYGYGKDPYCNVRDGEDMAMPVFGPFPIQSPVIR